ncbi:MAG: alpha-ribazole phosphatase [Clostridiales bacterium GWB2_37_7]|nr:MAG: alpha-ribazole phosphatase [Clostridiales bacterium GWB2_37_7]
MTKVYLIRHGETEYNQKGCYYGWTDCSLVRSGIEQAEALKRVFKDIKYDVMLTSDLKRAVETATIINDSKKLIIDSRLRELNFGQWEGKHYHEVMAQYTEHWNLWTEDWVNAIPTGGESIVEMYNRVSQYLEDALFTYKDKSIVIVSHKGTLRMIAVYLLGLPLEKMWCFDFDHGKYSLLEINEGHGSIKCMNNI